MENNFTIFSLFLCQAEDLKKYKEGTAAGFLQAFEATLGKSNSGFLVGSGVGIL